MKSFLLTLSLALTLSQNLLASPFLHTAAIPEPKSRLAELADLGCRQRGYVRAASTQFLQCRPMPSPLPFVPAVGCHQVLFTCR